MYRVFVKHADGNWHDLGEFEGASQHAVISQASGNYQGEEFFAVPSRSFHPVKYEEETVTRRRITPIPSPEHKHPKAKGEEAA